MGNRTALTAVIDILKPEIENTIHRLDKKEFDPDPIAGRHFSKITSVMSSAYKRHGNIIERAILEALRLNERYLVWEDPVFQVAAAVDHIVDGSMSQPLKLIGTDYPYSVDGVRTLQVDALVYDKEFHILRAYEIKRGYGLHDSGKRRSIIRDLLAVQVLLKSYGEHRNLEVSKAFSHIIFYYGKSSVPKPFSLSGKDLDEHFQMDIFSQIEEVNAYFQSRLFSILSGA